MNHIIRRQIVVESGRKALNNIDKPSVLDSLDTILGSIRYKAKRRDDNMESKLGKEVQDRVTGFRGIATSETEYLQGCTRINVQPKIKKDGALPARECFDEPDLIVIGDGVSAQEEVPPGGPREIAADRQT